jgi:hypothetical protein
LAFTHVGLTFIALREHGRIQYEKGEKKSTVLGAMRKTVNLIDIILIQLVQLFLASFTLGLGLPFGLMQRRGTYIALVKQ